MKYLYIENVQVTDALLSEATPIYAILSDNTLLVDANDNLQIGTIIRVINGSDQDGVYLIKNFESIPLSMTDYYYKIEVVGNKTLKANENKNCEYIGSILPVQEKRAPKDHVKLPQLAVRYHHLAGIQDFPQENDPRFNLVEERESGDLFYSSLEIDIPKTDEQVLRNLNYIYTNDADAVVLSVYDQNCVAYHVKVKEVIEASSYYTYVCMLLEPEFSIQASLDIKDLPYY